MQSGDRTKKTNCIKHPARVIAVTPSVIEVSVISQSACASCHAKGMCSSSDEKEKIITVPNLNQGIAVGDAVSVELKQSLGVYAVLLAYVLPLFLFIAAMLICSSAGLPELLTGGVSVVILGIYYFCLYLFRGKLQRVYNFHLVKI